jgi:UPF0755 protein
MKTLKVILMGIILAVIFGMGSYYYKIQIKKITINKTVEFEKGERVGELLKKIGVEEDLFLKVYFRISGVSSKIKAGYYQLNDEYTIVELFQILQEGRTEMVKVTIPEGYTIKEIKKLLIDKKMITEEEFQLALDNVKFPYITPNNNFEGYFFPDTYYFAKGSKANVIINTFLKEFLKRYPVEKYGQDESAKKDFYKKIILASIIEREAVLDEEKPIIASVFYNRLKKRMRLGSDATINYIFNYEKRRIYYKDLEIDSPYNTYKNYGLTPTPIGNPGKVSIEASLHPAKTNYLFFVATYDGTQSHHFTKTYKEHMEYQRKNKNKPK